LTFRHVGEERVFDGRFVHVAVATFEGPDGQTFEREVVRHRGAVGVVALTDGGTSVALVRQFRAAAGEDVLEIPAGMLDVDGESKEDAARRELEEEVGLRAIGPLEQLTEYYVAVGMTDEVFTLFLCRDTETCDARPQSSEEEHMTVEHVAIADVDGMIRDGRVRDAKTIVALLLVQRMVGRA